VSKRSEAGEAFLERCAAEARRTGRREEDAVEVAREWRKRNYRQENERLIQETVAAMRHDLTEEDDIEGLIKEFRNKRQ
jgi:hypothetical protein